MKGHKYVSNPVSPEGYVQWNETENNTWKTLIDRQSDIIQGRACSQYMKGLEILDFKSEVPQLPELNKILDEFICDLLTSRLSSKNSFN